MKCDSDPVTTAASAAAHHAVSAFSVRGSVVRNTLVYWERSDVIGSITAFVAEYGITHILLGRSRLPWYRRWFGRSLLDRLLQAIRGVNVTVVDNPSDQPSA